MSDYREYLREDEALLAQEDPPEYREPACPDQVFSNGVGQISIRSFLHDPYQAALVRAGWLQRLADNLRGYPELADKTLTVTIRPRFNKAYLDSGRGYVNGLREDKRNQHKNRFLLEVCWILPLTAPMDVEYHYEIMHNPASLEYPFDVLGAEVSYVWKERFNSEGLEEQLLVSGILKEVVVNPDRPDSELASEFMKGTLERPEFVLVEKQDHLLRVAINNPLTFPDDLAAWQDLKRVVEPVLVRDRRQLEAFRENLYSGLAVRKMVAFKGFRPASTGSLQATNGPEFSTFLAQLKTEDYYHLNYFSAWRGILDVWVSPNRSVISGGLCDEPLCGSPLVGAWDALEKGSQDERIWQSDPDWWGMDGETWTLRRSGKAAREISLWSPRENTLVEFSLELMRLAGLELDVERYVQWLPPGLGW